MPRRDEPIDAWVALHRSCRRLLLAYLENGVWDARTTSWMCLIAERATDLATWISEPVDDPTVRVLTARAFARDLEALAADITIYPIDEWRITAIVLALAIIGAAEAVEYDEVPLQAQAAMGWDGASKILEAETAAARRIVTMEEAKRQASREASSSDHSEREAPGAGRDQPSRSTELADAQRTAFSTVGLDTDKAEAT